MSKETGKDIENFFETVAQDIVDQQEKTNAENIIIQNFQISETEKCKVRIDFPLIFFSCKELSYDNDVHLNNHEVAKMCSLNFKNMESFINQYYENQQHDIENIKFLSNSQNNESSKNIVQFKNAQIKIKQKSIKQSSDLKKSQRNIFDQKFIKKSFIGEDSKIYQITFFPTQIVYIPPSNSLCKEIKCNLTIQEFMGFIQYSKENHIIDQLSEELTQFHIQLQQQVKDQNFDIQNSSLHKDNQQSQVSGQNQENKKQSAQFGIKQSKFKGNKMILALNFLDQLQFDQNNLEQLDSSHISNAILESYKKEFEIDFIKYQMEVTAPRFEISEASNEKVTVPCQVDILNLIIQTKFNFDIQLEP